MTISGLESESERSSRANETKPKDFHNKSAARGAYEFNDLITHGHRGRHPLRHVASGTPCWHCICVSAEFVKKVQENGSREIPKWNSTSLILILILRRMQPACPGGRRCNAHCKSYWLGPTGGAGGGGRRNCQMLACGQHLSVINARGSWTGSRIRGSQRRTSASTPYAIWKTNTDCA